jgi:ATP-dependent Lon protease
VRNLERQIAAISRKTARATAKDRNNRTRVTVQNLDKFLGIPRYRFGLAEKDNEVGVATGLAWTESGGETLAIEVTLMKGKRKAYPDGETGGCDAGIGPGRFQLYPLPAQVLKLKEDFHEEKDIHIHIPEGAIPKDGPSAGITMATAFNFRFVGSTRQEKCGHDGGDHPPGQGPAGGGHQGKGPGGPPGRHQKDHHAHRTTRRIPRKYRKMSGAAWKWIFVEHMDQVLEEALERKEK